MNTFFIRIVNVSITASILVLLVLIMRLFLKKAPKWINVLLWSLVAFRLLCPIGIESPLSLIPKTDWIPTQVTENIPNNFDSMPPDNIVVDPSVYGDNVTITYPIANDPQIEIRKGISTDYLLSCIWVSGMAVMVVYMLFSYVRIYCKIRNSKRFSENVYLCNEVETPFVFGLLRPRIYLPESMDSVNMSYVISHEKAHIRRLDHLWKPLGFLLLTVHWFNPLMWIAYVLLCRDIEMACDERVVKEYNDIQRADYSEALLLCSVNRSLITACPLAFGEVSVKTRIKSVLSYKKPTLWIVIIALLLCVATAVFFLTDPNTDKEPPVEPPISENDNPETPPEEPKKPDVSENVTDEPTNTAPEYDLPIPTPPYVFEVSFRDNTYFINTVSMDAGLEGSLSDIISYCGLLKKKGYNIEASESSKDGISADRPGYYFCARNSDGQTVELTYDGAGYSIYAVMGKTAADKNTTEDDDPQPQTVEDAAISSAVREHFRDEVPTGLLHFTSYNLLKKTEISGTPLYGKEEHVKKIIFYLQVLHQKYSMQNGKPTLLQEDLSPAVLTFDISDGSYTLEEYWEPRKGADYDADLKAKVPHEILEDLKDVQSHLDELKQKCDYQISSSPYFSDSEE